MIFAISNVIIQSSVNSFGSTVVAGNSAASNIEGFVYVSMNSFYQGTISFTSQNVGAGKYERVNKILFTAQACVIVTGLVLGNESCWYESFEDYMYSICAVWYYGCHGWLTARTWVFRDADDRISDWCVRTPTVVDIYIFPHKRAVPYTAVAVSDLSGKLDHHDLRTRGLLCDCAS